MPTKIKDQQFPFSILDMGKIILCLIFVFFIIVAAYLWLPAEVHYLIREEYSFIALEEDTHIYLAVVVPQTGPYQEVNSLFIIWEDGQEIESYDNVAVVKLWGEILAKERTSAVIEYEIIVPQGKVQWDAPVENDQTLPQNGIESDSLEIVKKAAELTSGSTRKDALSIFKFTSNYLTFSEEASSTSNHSALATLQTKETTCSGFAHLMVAISRASGIPAQMVIGIALPDLIFTTKSMPSQNCSLGSSHAWVEFFTEGSWHMADPSWGGGLLRFEFDRNDGRHVALGELGEMEQICGEAHNWVFENSRPLVSQNFRYYVGATKNMTARPPVITITRGWDGRIFNAVLVWLLVMVIFYLNRKKIVRIREKAPM